MCARIFRRVVFIPPSARKQLSCVSDVCRLASPSLLVQSQWLSSCRQWCIVRVDGQGSCCSLAVAIPALSLQLTDQRWCGLRSLLVVAGGIDIFGRCGCPLHELHWQLTESWWVLP